jgi:hypothetical protein
MKNVTRVPQGSYKDVARGEPTSITEDEGRFRFDFDPVGGVSYGFDGPTRGAWASFAGVVAAGEAVVGFAFAGVVAAEVGTAGVTNESGVTVAGSRVVFGAGPFERAVLVGGEGVVGRAWVTGGVTAAEFDDVGGACGINLTPHLGGD